MQLLVSPTSPYVRKVRIVALELDIDLILKTVNPWASDTDVGQHNPLGKIPALIIDGGQTIFDSAVIVEYLHNLKPSGNILPADPQMRVSLKTIEALGDGLLDAAVAIVIENRRPSEQQSRQAIDRQLNTLNRGLDYIEVFLSKHPTLTSHNEPINIGTIAIGVLAGYVDFRLPEQQLIAKRPYLAAWWSNLCTRPSFANTVPT